MNYLVVVDGVVVLEGRNLESLVREAVWLGYSDGYVTNQDGGRDDVATLIERLR